MEPLFGEAKQWHGLDAVPVARLREGEYREPADRGWAKPEAVTEEMGLGTAARPEWSGAGRRRWWSPRMHCYAVNEPGGISRDKDAVGEFNR